MDDLFPELKEDMVVKVSLPKEKKGRTGLRSLRPPKEAVMEALEVCHGNLTEAAKCFSYPDGTEVHYQTFINWVRKYDLKIYSDDIRTKIAKGCFDVLVKKATRDQETKAIDMILRNWGHYIGFEDTSKTGDKRTELGEGIADFIRNNEKVSRNIEIEGEIVEN